MFPRFPDTPRTYVTVETTTQTPKPSPCHAPGAAPGADYKLHRRFDRIGRLVGDPTMELLQNSHVVVFGVGGVGSYTAEALVRSGVGRLTLVDFDLVCTTNTNRQLHALQGTAGKPKVEVMAERLQRINPAALIEPIKSFYRAESSERLLGLGDKTPDFVVDAIDNMTAKCHLIATCHDEGIPLIVACGAAARLDPTRIQIADLNRTQMDPLARAVRKILREKYGFPSRALTGIPAIYSDEPPIIPTDLAYDVGEGFRCVCPQGDNGLHSCEDRNRIEGSAGFVTGAFGLAAASAVVRALKGEPLLPKPS
ncbi:MAG: tRNA threonylcarbamoyladenosine dehydratase [Deltaproteobacteria bacterium]|nr:tRNA threonylcarbamoyladenosine dehydratase [Deltaproteobacteria bacterium]